MNPAPSTVESLAADLKDLGLQHGDVLMPHASMSRLGFVAGGVHAVVLAEWRQSEPPRGGIGASVRLPDGTSKWVAWVDILPDGDDFDRLGADFEASGAANDGRIGSATARLMSQRVLVDFATSWLANHRRD
jgi:aminoglycoside 3-N-acetyltransferase